MLHSHGGFAVSHIGDAVLGFMWVGLLWLFIMYFYKYLFVYYRKAVIEDKKEFKVIYREINKKSRRIASALILYLLITLSLIFTVEEAFLRCVMKGFMVAIVVIPIANNHYGDEKRYKFHL